MALTSKEVSEERKETQLTRTVLIILLLVMVVGALAAIRYGVHDLPYKEGTIEINRLTGPYKMPAPFDTVYWKYLGWVDVDIIKKGGGISVPFYGAARVGDAFYIIVVTANFERTYGRGSDDVSCINIHQVSKSDIERLAREPGKKEATAFLVAFDECGKSIPNVFYNVQHSGIEGSWWPGSVIMKRTAEALLQQ